jgi:hypothetical protein
MAMPQLSIGVSTWLAPSPRTSGVRSAHPQAAAGQGTGQIHGHGALAHAALAAAHGNHLFHSRDRLAWRQLTAGAGSRTMPCGADRRALVSCRLTHLDLHIADALDGKHGLPCLAGDPALLALGEGRQAEPEDQTTVLQAGLLNPAQLQEAAPAAGVTEGTQGCGGLLQRCHQVGSTAFDPRDGGQQQPA